MDALAKDKLNNAEAHVNDAIAALDSLLQQSDNQFNQLQTQVIDELNSGQTWSIITLIAQTLTAIIAAVLTIRVMLLPLDGINNVLGYMAQGDLSRKIDCQKSDEYGLLSANINNVVEDLTRLISHQTRRQKTLRRRHRFNQRNHPNVRRCRKTKANRIQSHLHHRKHEPKHQLCHRSSQYRRR